MCLNKEQVTWIQPKHNTVRYAHMYVYKQAKLNYVYFINPNDNNSSITYI